MTTTLLTLLCASAVTAGPMDKPVKGSNRQATEHRELAEFDHIELRINADVQVLIAEEVRPLEIEADDNLLPLITTEVEDGRLVIDSSRPFKTKHSPDIKIEIPSLVAVEIYGSGDMNVHNLANETFSGMISGSADLRLYGKAGNLAVSVYGSGDVFAQELNAQNAVVSIKGSGDVRVRASDTLAVTIEGSGDVFYNGSPTVSQIILGSGDVKARDD